MRISEQAPAKINLALHVTGRRDDGYHLLDSLVVFARIGDLIEAEPAEGLSLTLDGPFGQELGAGPDNLVLRAAALARPKSKGAALRLIKILPVASGIGGGSADAAATLRLLSRLWGGAVPAPAEVLGLGADVPVCLAERACRMRGVGEDLTFLDVPSFWMLLVNPRVPVPTGAVFAGLARRDHPPMAEPDDIATVESLFSFLAAQRNDLQASAVALAPVIAEVLKGLEAQAGCRIARMSGSGATCFGLFAREADASRAGQALARARPNWWIAATPSR